MSKWLEKGKVVITLFTGVYSNDEYLYKPEFCEIQLTEKDIDRIKEMKHALEEHGFAAVSDPWRARWFDKRPAYTFDELPEKFIVLDDYRDTEYEFGEEKDPDADINFGIDTERLDVSEYGIYIWAYGERSSSKFESIEFGIKLIEDELAKPEPTPRENYYFNEARRNDQDDPIPPLEDLPKYLNDDDPGMRIYAKEMLKRGCIRTL